MEQIKTHAKEMEQIERQKHRIKMAEWYRNLYELTEKMPVEKED